MRPDPSAPRFTSIGRPLDPAWPTNRAVLVLMPLAALGFAVISLSTAPGDVGAAVSAAILGVGTVLGCWALGREIAPDDQAAAFVAMGLGVGTALWNPDARLLPLFVALMLARIVNRTVGPAAKLPDTLAVVALTGLGAFTLRWPELWLAAALTFWTDARYDPAILRHRIAAALCVAVAGAQALAGPRPDVGFVTPWAIAGTGVMISVVLVVAGFVGVIVTTSELESTADVTGERLSPARVRAGMVIVLLLAVLGLVSGGAPAERSALTWATLAGVTLSTGLRRLLTVSADIRAPS